MTDGRQPSGAALTWGVRPARTRGPAPSLTVEDIAAAGVAIADHDGLPAVTMEAVAGSLGCTKMALYRYLAGKADLVAVMFDAAVGDPPAGIRRARSWHSALRRWASGLLDRYRAHPWAADVPLGTAALTRNQARWLEAALAAMAGLPLRTADKLDLVLLLNGHVLFTARLGATAAAAGDGAPDPDLAAALASAGLPHVSAALRAGHLSDGDGAAAAFSRGLDYVLAGIAARAGGQPSKR